MADPLSVLAARGTIGLIAALAILGAGYLIREIKASHKRETTILREEIARLRDEVAALRTGLDASYEFTRDRTVPALTTAGEALARSTEINREFLQQMARGGPR